MKVKKEINEWFIKVDGVEVTVSKEVYIEYRNNQSKERMKNLRRSRCMVPNSKGGMRLCDKTSCSECPHKKTGTMLSLDRLYEDYEFEVADGDEDIIEYINREERAAAVRKAISELNDIDRTIATMVLSDDKSETETAKKLGISQSAVHQRKVKIVAVLQEKLKDYRF